MSTLKIMGVAAGLALGFATLPALAFEPERDVTIVVTSSAGGGSDTATRILASVIDELELTPVNFLVENRTGGSGSVGYSFVAGRTGDPYLWTKVGVSFFTTPLMGESPVSYTDFTPLAAISVDPYIMVVAANSPIQSLDDIIESGRMISGTTGIVADPALLAQKLQEELEIEVDIVPFGGDGEVTAALLGGHIEVQFGNPSEVLELIEAGEVRAIAASSDRRVPGFDDIPTFVELGYDVVQTQLRGFVMPRDVPEDAVGYWTAIIEQAVASPQWKEQYLDRFNAIPYVLSGAEFQAEMDRRNEEYTELMTTLGIIE
ncbi:Bug family tripartite tricarboxylate transporter substrate binding protein [Pelagibacterium lacus]|uniref:Tripartite tricarboxylate transporter substrate binding protein n=1 Tax=Pelagibacterium lacus TaxID=2282655 RepID=A0A369VZK1_9HYPH|nr:tripartite tricarboxylate transporter substrate binding protein [Pelagibacterium lacus]RDE07738.1 tripartite tricarboxylate transporter substrate binding protein [Pelagibacterium lacus]